MHLPGIYHPSNRLISSIGNYYKQKRYKKYFAFPDDFTDK